VPLSHCALPPPPLRAQALANLSTWMADEVLAVPTAQLPAHAKLVKSPLGVALILAP